MTELEIFGKTHRLASGFEKFREEQAYNFVTEKQVNVFDVAVSEIIELAQGKIEVQKTMQNFDALITSLML